MMNALLRGVPSPRSVILGIATTAIALAASAQVPPGTMPSQESNIAGVVAEITEAKRQDGVLTVRLRLRNTGGDKVRADLVTNRNYDSFYLTANNKKYFVLRDSEKTPLAPETDSFGKVSPEIAKGGSYTFWAKFPAPPADVKKFSYFSPVAPPFDNVPITD